MNGDGRLDLILPEGWWEQPAQASATPWIRRKGAHGFGLGSEVDSPAVLYWFKLTRETGKPPHYQPYLIDSQTGVGTQLIVADVNGDGSPDILTAGRAGAFLFLNQKKSTVGITLSRAGLESGSPLRSGHSTPPAWDFPEWDLTGRARHLEGLDGSVPHVLIVSPQ